MNYLVYRCDCGALVEVEQDEGDCEDDEIICPACEAATPIAEVRRASRIAPARVVSSRIKP